MKSTLLIFLLLLFCNIASAKDSKSFSSDIDILVTLAIKLKTKCISSSDIVACDVSNSIFNVLTLASLSVTSSDKDKLEKAMFNAIDEIESSVIRNNNNIR